uniref:Biogenesis of lysosome-related organelles complex 1 subunit 3 n=1 Tax=Caenorhabditis tropicalis TaxID=1561998 RepID=A0A1I7UNX3_9PELO
MDFIMGNFSEDELSPDEEDHEEIAEVVEDTDEPEVVEIPVRAPSHIASAPISIPNSAENCPLTEVDELKRARQDFYEKLSEVAARKEANQPITDWTALKCSGLSAVLEIGKNNNETSTLTSNSKDNK